MWLKSNNNQFFLKIFVAFNNRFYLWWVMSIVMNNKRRSFLMSYLLEIPLKFFIAFFIMLFFNFVIFANRYCCQALYMLCFPTMFKITLNNFFHCNSKQIDIFHFLFFFTFLALCIRFAHKVHFLWALLIHKQPVLEFLQIG